MMILPASKGQIKKAIQDCSKELGRSPGNTRLRLKLGDLHLKNGDREKAIKEYLQTAELYAKGDLATRAIAMYKKVLSIDPNHVEAIRRMAALFLEEGLLGDAGACHEKILKIKPGDREAIGALSVIENTKQLKGGQTVPQMEEIIPVRPLGSPPPGSSDGAVILSLDEVLELH
jgi:tetratricopeptide (TPR) repeat protein